MNKQPEALRLAKELVSVHKGHADEGPSTFSEAAAELRRLHEANQAMLEALKIAEKQLVDLEHAASGGDDEIYVEGAIFVVREAIAKGEQQ